jgi:hypothetical protein
VVTLLVERGADPAIAPTWGVTPLMFASSSGHLEIVRFLLGHDSATATINCRDRYGETALFKACRQGHGGVVRALLESGADPTIADNKGITPLTIAKRRSRDPVTVEGRRECVAPLKVSGCCCCLFIPWHLLFVDQLAEAWSLSPVWQEAERAYLLWKARQVADAAASFAAPPLVEERTRGEARRRRVEAVPEEVRGRAAAEGGEGLPGVSVVAIRGKWGQSTRAALVEHAVHSLKPGVFEELMEMMGVI